jgi:hypothetical protein
MTGAEHMRGEAVNAYLPLLIGWRAINGAHFIAEHLEHVPRGEMFFGILSGTISRFAKVAPRMLQPGDWGGAARYPAAFRYAATENCAALADSFPTIARARGVALEPRNAILFHRRPHLLSSNAAIAVASSSALGT